jgi:hypothetical protein
MVQTAFKNNVYAGQFAYNKPYSVARFNKKDGSGSTFQIPRGFLIAKDPALTTKDTMYISKAASVRPFAICIGSNYFKTSGVGYPMTSNDLTVIGAKDTDTQVVALYVGEVPVYIDGVVQHNSPVMPSDGSGSNVLGHLMAWNGSDEKAVVGNYLGLPGQRDGRYLATATPNAIGTIGWIQLTP